MTTIRVDVRTLDNQKRVNDMDVAFVASELVAHKVSVRDQIVVLKKTAEEVRQFSRGAVLGTLEGYLKSAKKNAIINEKIVEKACVVNLHELHDPFIKVAPSVIGLFGIWGIHEFQDACGNGFVGRLVGVRCIHHNPHMSDATWISGNVHVYEDVSGGKKRNKSYMCSVSDLDLDVAPKKILTQGVCFHEILEMIRKGLESAYSDSCAAFKLTNTRYRSAMRYIAPTANAAGTIEDRKQMTE